MLFTSSSDFTDPDPGSAGPSAARRAPSSEIEALKFDVERLLLITEALWRIVQEKHELPETELIKHITTLDLEDGKLDGRNQKPRRSHVPSAGVS